MNVQQKVPTKRKLKRNNDILPKTKVPQDECIEEEEYPVYDIEKADNFESLLQSSVCNNNSFFKLKSEQKWDCERNSDNQLCNYFKLNLERLNAGVNCLPISKRHDIKELSDAHFFDKKPTIYLQKYKNYLDQYKKILKRDKSDDNNKDSANHINPITKVMIEDKTKQVNWSLDEEKHETKVPLKTSTEDDLDELLHLTISECKEDQIIAEDPLLETKSAIAKIPTQTTDDLEDWLDDILDN